MPGSAAAGRDKAPLSAAQAVTTILDGVRSGSWRIRSARTKTIEVCDRCDEFRGAKASQGACETPRSGRTPDAAGACAELGRMVAEAPAATTPER